MTESLLCIIVVTIIGIWTAQQPTHMFHNNFFSLLEITKSNRYFCCSRYLFSTIFWKCKHFSMIFMWIWSSKEEKRIRGRRRRRGKSMIFLLCIFAHKYSINIIVPIKFSQFVWQSNKNRFMLNFVVQTHRSIQMCMYVPEMPRNIYAQYFLEKFTFRSELGIKWEISTALTDFRIIMMMPEQIIVFAAFQCCPNNRPKIKS